MGDEQRRSRVYHVSKSMTAHTGSSAIRGDVVGYSILAIAPIIHPTGRSRLRVRPASGVCHGMVPILCNRRRRFGINVELFKGGESGTLVALAASRTPRCTDRTRNSLRPSPTSPSMSGSLASCSSGRVAQRASSTQPARIFLLDDLAFGGRRSDGISGAARDLPALNRITQSFNPGTVIATRSRCRPCPAPGVQPSRQLVQHL